jgi:predicted  nucleic acid-binding Zn-ribbon protein
MNQELRDIITRLETRVRQLILQQEKQQEELGKLRQQLNGKDDEILELQIQNEELKQQYSRLKMAKYIDMADNDVKDMRGRIRTMVRDIDKCISMLKVTQ